MSMRFKLFCLISLLLLGSVTQATELEDCKDLKRIYTPYPHYPKPHQVRSYFPGTSYAHNFVEGFIEVEYFVELDGRVKTITVLGSEEKVYPRDRGMNLKGFFESNVIPTLKKWKYEKIEKVCKVKAKYTYVFDKNS